MIRRPAVLIAVLASAALFAVPAEAADRYVSLYSWGASPAELAIDRGDTVHFTNSSGQERRIVDTGGLLDSGPLPPGAGYSVAVTAPGVHEYTTTGVFGGQTTARIRVRVTELAGVGGAPATGAVLDLPFPGTVETDIGIHPEFGIYASRTQILLRFVRGATVAQANAALARAGVEIRGGLPELGLLLVAVPDSGTFGPLDAALASLSADPAVDVAAMSPQMEEDAVPKTAEKRVHDWRWEVKKAQKGGPGGEGGNWGLEASRFPQAWNLRAAVERRQETDPEHAIRTVVVDAGFEPHEDLSKMTYRSLCRGSGAAQQCTQTPAHFHGNHVTGIIGADYNNPAPGTGRSRGVSGTNPVALIDTVSVVLSPQPNAVVTLSDTLDVWSRVLGEAKARTIRVGNFSGGVKFAFRKLPDTGRIRFDWWYSHRLPRCGPGEFDDNLPGSNQWCTPQNDDRWIASGAGIGSLGRDLAERAADAGMTIVQSAGNESNLFCLPPLTGSPIPDADLPCDTPGGSLAVIDAVRTSPFGWAARHWTASKPNPVIVVENIQRDLSRHVSSNTGGDLSAPGTGILSTVLYNSYDVQGGTSMAAPHVAGLVGYLLAFEPTLTPDQVLARLKTWALEDTENRARPRIDAFATLLASPRAARALVDVNDRSRDGRRRVVLGPDNKETGTDVTAMTPDDKVDMRDFRAFRDAWLETCQIDKSDGCPSDISLNGGKAHPKLDLNLDGCVVQSADCDDPVKETVFPRFDFNGNGVVERTKPAPVPLQADGTPAATRADETEMSDLDVLAKQFKDDEEGWTGEALPKLLVSGDLEIHADQLFDAGATSVDFTFKSADGKLAIPPRTLKPAPNRDEQFLVATVPAQVDVTLEAVAHSGAAAKTKAVTQTLKLKPGQDRRLDLCKPLTLQALPAALPADGETTTDIRVSLVKCGAADTVAGKTVALKAEPAAGVTLAPAMLKTDAAGNAIVKLKGTQTGRVVVSASADLGGGKSATDEVEIELTKKIQVAYLWKQSVEDWSEKGTTDWPDELASPASPDCRTAPVEAVPYCITAVEIGLVPGEPDDGLTRSGTLTGGGERFALSQTVTNTDVASKAEWTVVDRRNGHEWPGGRTVKQHVSDPDAYRDHAFDDGELASVETDDRLYLFGMQWVGDLPYHYAREAVVTPGTTFVPKEIHAAPDRLMLVPQDPSIRFAGPPGAPVVFAKDDGRFGQFRSCWLYDRDISHTAPGWYDPWADQWGGVTGRTDTYLPGRMPMPVGPGHLRIRYSFAAVAWYDGEAARTPTLPDCTKNNAPVAAFESAPAVALEGRQVHFVDRSLDAENDISEWRWDFGDGSTSTDADPHHMFPDNATYTVSLTVVDGGGRADTVTHELSVENVAPEADIDDVDAVAGSETVVEFLLVDASKVDKSQLEYRIESTNPNWPAGVTGTVPAGGRRVRFPGEGLPPGTYPLTLTVTDKDGASAVAEAFLVVAASPPAACDPATGENCAVALPPAEFATCEAGVTLDEEEHQFLVLLNAYRAQNGLVPVAVSPTLTKAAEAHAHDMAVHDFMGHVGSDGSTFFQRAWREGYPERQAVSENVASGTASGFAALQAWKSSQTGHNENMLNPAWRAIGIAREQGGEWRWATSYGNLLDCPALDVETAPAEPGSDGEPAVMAESLTPPLTHPPLTALAISNVQPRAKRDVVFRNRSRDANGTPVAATLRLGDATPPVALGPDGEYTHRYTTPYYQTPSLTATDAAGREETVTRTMWVEPQPQPYLSTTPYGVQGLAGKTVDVRAVAMYTAPIPGLDIRFALAGQSVVARTGADGAASATLSLAGLSAGSYTVDVTFAGDDDWAASSSSISLGVIQNLPPRPDTGGPYVAGNGRALLLDGTRSSDPDAGDRIVAYEWDLNGDGTYGDATGSMPAPLVWADVQTLVCGGVCFNDTDYPIRLKATDTRGDSAIATTTVRFTSDFALSLGGGGKTIVPGLSNSFAVSVVGSGGFTSPVTLSAVGLPAGVTASFSVNPIAPSGISVLTISASGSVGAGSFPIVVTGTSNGITHTVSDQIDVAFGLIPVCKTSFTGIVRDKVTGTPVAGAAVNGSYLSQVVSDASGRYRIDNVALGTNNAPLSYNVQAHKDGYWSALTYGTAACGAPTVVDLEVLPKQLGKVKGTVVVGVPDPANHNSWRAVGRSSTPLAGVTIGAPIGPVPLTTVADGRYDGGFELNTNNTARFHQVTASVPGHWPQTKGVTLDALTTKTLDFELVEQCYGKIRGGVVRWADTGEVVPGASVEWRFSSTDRGTMLTNASGAYDFDKTHLLGVNNSIAYFTLKATPPAGSAPGATGQTLNVSLADCASETGGDLVITRPKLNQATLEGYVLDQDTGAPVPFAWVSYGYDSRQADAAGFYRFANIFIGYDTPTSVSKTLSASAEGFYPASLWQTIVAGSTHRVDLRLLRMKHATATGVVKDAVTGVPIPNAEVGCWYPAPFCTHTGRDGRYSSTDVTLGSNNSSVTSNIRASADEYWPQTKFLKYEADKTTASDFELVRRCPTARISGTVVNAETQAPIMGAWITGGDRYDFSDELGRFELEDVVPGSGNAPLEVQITAQASGFFTAWKNVTIFCGANVTVDFGARENSSGAIAGTITNADTGKPIAGLFVGTEFGGTATTDTGGNYRIDHVPLGDLDADREWKVTVAPAGFKQQSKTVVAHAGATVRADFAFTVAGNRRPTADPQHVELDEDRWADVTLTGADADGDRLVYHLMRYPQHGQITGSPPDLRYYPDQDYHGTDSFAFATHDGLALSAEATVDLVVASVNDGPIASFDNLTADEETPLVIRATELFANDRDPDGDVLLLDSVFKTDARFTLTQLGDTILFTPLPGLTGTVYFQYTVADGQGATTWAWVAVNVRHVPGTPACAGAAFAGPRDKPLAGAVVCTDRDGDHLTYALGDAPQHGAVVLGADGRFTYTPAAGFRGLDAFTFTASDGALVSRVATATLDIGANHAPVAADGSVALDEDTPAPVTLAANDPDGDVLAFTIVTAPEHGTLSGNAPDLTYTPQPGYSGADSFTFVARDGTEASAEATVTVTVAAVNDAALASADSVETDEDQPASIAVLDNDSPGDGEPEQALAVALVTQPAHGTAFAIAGGTVFYLPAVNWNGNDTFSYTVCDDGAPSECASAQVAVTVAPVNDRPSASGGRVAVDEDAPPLTIDLAEFAADFETGDPDLAYTVVSRPQHGSVSGSGRMLTYDSDDDANGRDSFTFRVVDRGDPDACLPLAGCSPPLASSLRTVLISIAPVNDTPTLSLEAPGTIPADEVAQLTGVATDVDGDLLDYTWRADGGALAPTGAGATLASAEPATIHVTLTVSDGRAEAAASATVTFEPVAPQVDAGADVAVDEGSAVTLAATSSEPGTTTVDWGDGSPAGTALDASHVYADDGAYTVTVRVTDDHGRSGEDTLTVRARNVAPRVDAGGDVTIDEGGTLAAAASFVDPGADTHTISIDWGEGSAPAASLDATHVYADEGSYTVAVRITDDDGGVGEATRTVTVRNVAPAVEAGPDASVDEGDSFTLAASLTDPGVNDTHTVSVDWGDGQSGTGLTDSHPYVDDGTYTVTITATDNDGGTGTDTLHVTVRNVAPAVEAGADSSLDEGGTFTLAASLADRGARDTHTVAVDWGDGGAGEGLTGGHRYDDNGTFTVTVTARDDDGGVGSDTLSVSVRNLPPMVDAGPDRAAPWGVSVPLVGIAVDPSSADTAAGLSGRWRFGDGTESTNLAPLHAYAAPGRYDAVLTVADKDGGAASDSVAVTIGKRATRLVYTGPTRTAFGATVLSARLEDTVDAPTAKLAGRAVRFTLNGATFTATTDASGAASVAARVTGGTMTADFAGDELYEPARVQSDLTVTYDFGGAGFFAIGDGNAARGTAVTFWDAQWSQENELTAGDAPSSFKGWVARDGAPACAQSWTTGPGNSTTPPATVPRYLAVVVTGAVTKSGSTIEGKTGGIVVVETSPGYGPAPGHPGTGTVVARVC